MRLYLGNKMVGIRQFNFPWFDAVAAELRALSMVTEVFNPAERDREVGFYPAEDCLGTVEDMAELHFSRRAALATDYAWICDHSDGMVAGQDWMKSTGTISEIAIHQALGLPVWETGVFMAYWDDSHLIEMKLPPIMELGRPLRGDTPWQPWASGRY
jgi:hypothetical protein